MGGGSRVGEGGGGSGHESHTDTGSEQQVPKETRPDTGDALAAKVPSISMENGQPFKKWHRDNCTSTGKKGIPPLTYATHKDDLKRDHTATVKANKAYRSSPRRSGSLMKGGWRRLLPAAELLASLEVQTRAQKPWWC